MAVSSSDRDPIEELAESFLARFRAGERPSLTEYTAAHPELADQIRELFPALVEMEQAGSAVGPATGPGIARAGAGGAPLTTLGDFRIVREVGRGGMGVVYEAVQESLGRHVALKVFAPWTRAEPKLIERFQREARAAARLHHTNIVPVFGVGAHGADRYYAMQFIQGQGLDAILEELRHLRSAPSLDGAGPAPPEPTRSAPLAATVARSLLTGRFAYPATETGGDGTEAGSLAGLEPAEASRAPAPAGPSSDASQWASEPGASYTRIVARVGLQVAEALAHAHGQGVLHRDIKPSNLLLDVEGHIWVTDFGLAKSDDAEALTEAGDIVGTVRYMAPERFRGESGPGSDVYGLGVTIYELLTMRPAFDEGDRAHLIDQILHSDPPPPRVVEPKIPRDLETIVLKAKARDPADRYGSAVALAEDLRRFLDDRTILARRSSVPERVWRWCKRNPMVAGLIAAVFLVMATGTAVSTWQAVRATRATSAALRERRTAEDRLWESLRDQAHAMRMSRQPGQRVESLRSVAQAMRLRQPAGHSLAELRTEAAAALSLPDIQVEREWEGGEAPGVVGWAIDRKLERYARLASDGAVTVRSTSDDRLLARWQGDLKAPWRDAEDSVNFSPDGHYLAISHPDTKQLLVLRLDETGPVVCHRGENAPDCRKMSFTPDSATFAYLQNDSRIAAVVLGSGEVRYLPPAKATQDFIEFAPDGRRLAIGINRAGSDAAEIRDLSTGQVETTLAHPAGVDGFAWHPDGQTLATGCYDRVIRLWNVPTGKRIRTLEGHRTHGIRCDFDSTGRWLLSNDWSGNLRLWETSSGRQVLSFPGGWTDLLRVSPDDHIVVYKHGDVRRTQLLRLWGGAVYRTIVPSTKACDGHFRYPVHSGGRLVAIGTADAIALVDLATGTRVAELPSTAAPLCWDPTGALITAGSSGQTRWPVITTSLPGSRALGGGERDRPIYRIGPSQRLLASVSSEEWGASADGRTIAISQFNAGALVVHRSRPMTSIRLQPQEDVRHCAVSPDGRWVATGSHTCTDGLAAKVWDAATGRLSKALPVPAMCNVDFSPDGRWLLTTSGGCRLWKVGSWLDGPEIGGTAGCFSPDGRYVAVDAWPGIRLVETDTGIELLRLAAPEPMRFVPRSFTPDGAQIIAFGEDEAVHVWDLRVLRQGLDELGLDWNAPPYPSPSPAPTVTPPLQVNVDLGHLDPARRRELEEAMAANKKAWSLATDPLARRRDPVGAITLAHTAVTLVPNEANFWNTLGVAHFRTGHWTEAIESLTKATDLFAADLESFDAFLIAMSHWQLGDKDKARQWFDIAVQSMDQNQDLFQRDNEAIEALRVVRFEAEDLLGISNFAKAIKSHPKTATAWSDRGDAYLRLRQWPKAIDDCSEAIKLNPKLTRARMIRGEAYMGEGQWAKAAADYGEVLTLDPNNDWYWYPTAALRLQIGDTQGYRRICRDVLERFGNNGQLAERISKTCLLIPDAVSDLGLVFELADRAVAGTEQHPSYLWFMLAKGLAEYRAGRDSGAVAWLTRISPKADGIHYDAAAFSILAMAQRRLGRAEAAREALGHARAILTEKMPDPGAGRPFAADFPFRTLDTHDWLHAEILFQEARAVVGADKKTNPEDTRKGAGSR